MDLSVVFGLLLTLLAPTGYRTGDVDPAQFVAFLAGNRAIMHIWNLIIFVVFGVFLVVLSVALYERLRAGSPAMVQTAAAFWWASSSTHYRATGPSHHAAR